MPDRAIVWKRTAFYVVGTSGVLALIGGGAHLMGYRTIGDCALYSSVAVAAISLGCGIVYFDRSMPHCDDDDSEE